MPGRELFATRGELADRLRGWLPGVLAIVATYTYFLLFAQFGFLSLLKERLGGAESVQRAMGAMGMAGLAGSLLAARWLARHSPLEAVAASLALAALVAPATLAARGEPALIAAAAAVGLATGLLAVALATALSSLLPTGRLGIGAGIGTGIAYLLANVPALFGGSTAVRAIAPATGCAIALLAVVAARPGTGAAGGGSGARSAYPTIALARRGLSGAVLAFTALVALDSTAFAVIQAAPALRHATWGEGGRTLAQGLVHLAGALLAGWVAGRGRLRALLGATLALFAVAFALLATGGTARGAAGALYAFGIALYSVALVVYAGHPATRDGDLPPRLRAAWLFGIAGWLGSATGVATAQRLHAVPFWLVGAATVLLAAGLLLSAPAPLRRAFAPAGVVALLLVGGTLLGARSEPAGAPQETAAGPPEGADAPTSQVALGRRVYLAEGCVHCHSQYVRPGTRDESMWGPHRPLDRAQRPPLVGTRRQGPDLANAGNRRSAEWHRLHLLAPRALAASSRMPSYAHLFADGDVRGPALVAYLVSLGAGSEPARWVVIGERERRAPQPQRSAGSEPERGRRLFTDHCAACHGARGHGDGPFAGVWRRPTLDLRRAERTAEDLPLLLRTIRYGIPGTSMPGHETLHDDEVAALAGEVLRLGPGPTGGE